MKGRITTLPKALWRSGSAAIQSRSAITGFLSLTVLTNVVALTVNLGSGIIQARALGPQGRGELTVTMLWPTLIAAVGGLGLSESVAYYTATDKSRRSTVLATCFAIGVPQTLGLVLIGWSILRIVLAGNPQLLSETRFYLWVVPLSLLTRYIQGYLQGRLAMGWFNLTFLCTNVVSTALLAVLWFSHHLTVHSALAAALASWAITGGLCLVSLVGRRDLTWRPNPRLGRPLLWFGMRQQAGTIALTVVQQRLDLIVLSVVVSTAALGTYAVASSAGMVASTFPIAASFVLYPVFARQRSATLPVAVSRFLLVGGLITCVAGPVLLLLIPFAVPYVYGSAFKSARALTALLALGYLIRGWNIMLGSVISGSGRPFTASIGQTVELTALGVLLAILTPRFGMAGAATAMILAASMSFICLLGSVHFFTKLTPTRLAALWARDIRAWHRSWADRVKVLSSDQISREDRLPSTSCRPQQTQPLRWPQLQRLTEGARSSTARLFAAITLMAAAAFGGLVGCLGLSTVEPVLIGVIALVLAAPVAYRIIHSQFDLFEPIAVVNAVLAYFFVVRPAADLIVGSTYNVQPTFTSTLLLVLAGIVALEFGYLLPLGKKLSSTLPLPSPTIAPGRLVRFAVVLTICAIVLFAAFIVTSGGTSVLALLGAGRSHAASSVYGSSTGYLYAGPTLGVPACLVLVALALTGKRRRRAQLLVLSAIPAAVIVGTALPQGNRTVVLVLALPVLALPYIVRRRRPRWFAIVVFAYVFLTVGGYMTQNRNATVQQDTQSSLLSAVNPLTSAQYWITGLDGSEFDILAVELQAVPSAIPFSPGATLIDIGTRAVPRVVWPAKPLERSDALTVSLFPSEYYGTRNDLLPTVVGILYMDSGVLTVLVGMAVFGLMLRTLWSYFQLHSHALFAQILYLTCLPAIFLLVRDSPVEVFSGLIFTVAPLVPMFWFAREPTRDSARVSAARPPRASMRERPLPAPRGAGNEVLR